MYGLRPKGKLSLIPKSRINRLVFSNTSKKTTVMMIMIVAMMRIQRVVFSDNVDDARQVVFLLYFQMNL